MIANLSPSVRVTVIVPLGLSLSTVTSKRIAPSIARYVTGSSLMKSQFNIEKQNLAKISVIKSSKIGIYRNFNKIEQRRRFMNAWRNDGAVSTVSALALMVLYATFGSLAQFGSGPTAKCPRCAAWSPD